MIVDAELRLQSDPSRYTWARFLEDIVDRHRDRVAIRFDTGSGTGLGAAAKTGSDPKGSTQQLRYWEIEAQARQLAKGLVGAGVVKGARVAVLFANRPEWVIASFATSLVGAVMVPVNTFATVPELDYIFRHSDASVLLLQKGLLKRDYLREITAAHPEITAAAPGRIRCPALPSLRSVFCFGLEAADGGAQTWESLLAFGRDVDDELIDSLSAEVTPADDGVVIYTSGTTAHPKGVLHLQRAPVIMSWRFAEHYELGPDDVVWTAQPFFWTAGICMSLGATLAAGGSLILQQSFDAEAGLRAIERERATVVHAWPHQEKALAEHPSASSRDLSSVSRLNLSSPLAPLCGVEKDEWGTQGSYGMSETFTLASAIPAAAPAALREATSGKPLPGMAVRIVDPDTGARLPDGEKGEIAVKGLTFMRGYYKVEPELFLDADGFYHTQDGGWLDSDGYLHWSGRLSNLIKTGGANVSPLEIEQALTQYPGLRVGLAVGVPHPALGEAIVLCAVRLPGAEISQQAVREFLRERLAAYKVPKCVLVFDEGDLAFTGNQKIQLGPLREAAETRLAAEGIEIDGHRYQPASSPGSG